MYFVLLSQFSHNGSLQNGTFKCLDCYFFIILMFWKMSIRNDFLRKQQWEYLGRMIGIFIFSKRNPSNDHKYYILDVCIKTEKYEKKSTSHPVVFCVRVLWRKRSPFVFQLPFISINDAKNSFLHYYNTSQKTPDNARYVHSR